MVQSQSQIDKQMQQRTESTFQVKRIEEDQPSATAILNDLCSAKSASDYYRKEISKRHQRFESEKQWPNLSPEEAKLIEHYQNYMVNVKQQQDKIMKTASYKPTQRDIEASEVESVTSETISTVSGSTTTSQNRKQPSMANPVIVQRNRRVNEQHLVGQTIYTVYSCPEVVSYKEMSGTHSTEDTAKLERVRKLIFEIKKSPKYGADIMRGFVTRNAKIQRHQMLDQADSRCLMNLSNLFYDNLYLEEIKGQHLKQSYFVLAFQNFVSQLQFKKDQAENVIIGSPAALKVTKVLFEGQTRKIGANDFLRHIYTSKFSQIFIPQLQELIIRQILNQMNPRNRASRSQHRSMEPGLATPEVKKGSSSQSIDKAQKDKKDKPGFFSKLAQKLGNIVSSKEERDAKKQAKSETSSAAASSGSLDADDFIFENSTASQDVAANGRVPQWLDAQNPGNSLSKSGHVGGPKDRSEPEINDAEYERIRIMLGAGQHGDQPRLSDIFLKEERLKNTNDIGSKDPYNAMRYLNQEIDDEIQNKNSMLKDLMTDQHNDPVQASLQVKFDTEQFFNLQRQILNGGSPPDQAQHDSLGKQDKDLTEVCKGIVHQVLKSLVISTDLMPYTLRAMMKVLVMKSENVAHQGMDRQLGADQPKNKPKLGRNQIFMLADLMIGCWLNTGFRNPNCFGVLQPTDREKGFSHNLFQSCRVIFEHLFSLQKLPEKSHQNFDVKRINDYIHEYKDFVYIFYTRIIDVELPEPREKNQGTTQVGKKLVTQTQQALKYNVNSSLIRLQDLQLIGQILRSQQAVLRFGDISSLAQQIDWNRFKDSEETYFLFIKLKKDRVIKMPSQEQNEVKASKMLENLANHFPADNAAVMDVSFTGSLALIIENGKLKKLPKNFSHPIKKDKRGLNPAPMLIRVLYKHLIQLLEQNAVLVDEQMHGHMNLDQLLDYIKGTARFKEDASGIVITCQLMKKALKGLRLIPKKTMSEEDKQHIKQIQNRLLEKFVQTFRDTTKHSYFHALITQDLKYQNFEGDVDRFIYRSKGLQESIEKVIAQWQIAKISAQEVSLCVYQNQKDEFPCFQGIYLTRNCPIDQEWAALANVIAFDIFDTPRLPTNLNNQQQYLVPNQNRLLPARKDKQKIIQKEYKKYTDFTWVSILRPLCNQHREITYLESLLLYLTQECKQIFTSLIKCDYLLETNQVKAIRSQNRALLKNSLLRPMSNTIEKEKNQSWKCPHDLSKLKGTKIEVWAKEFLRNNEHQWKMWHAQQRIHYGEMYPDQEGDPNTFVKFIEIDEKFARMQFIQHSIRQICQGKSDVPKFLLEIDQLLQDRDREGNLVNNGSFIKQRMSKGNLLNQSDSRDGNVITEIQDHGNFLATFDFFLDNLLCDFSQSVDSVKDYDQILRQDMNNEKIRQSCQEFILRRIHNCLFEKMPTSDWDRAMFKIITNRKNKMQSGHKPDNVTQPMYQDKEKDLNLYKVSIDMLKQLPKQETPRAKRRLLNEAFGLAKHALSVLKEVEQLDHDYLFAYLIYYACSSGGRRRQDFRLFQQLVFMKQFGNKSGSSGNEEDAIDHQFKSLRDAIQQQLNEQACNTIKKSSFIVF